MSEKQGSASLPIKKRKVYVTSYVKEGHGGEAVIDQDPPPTEIADILDSLSASKENKPRNQDSKDDDDDDDDRKNDKAVVYQKSLTWDDVFYCRLVIPLEDGIEFMPAPSKYKGRHELKEVKLMDHKKRTWKMTASFDELTSSYYVLENWDKYLKEYKLEPEDEIFLYGDAADDTHLLIEFKKRNTDEAIYEKILVYKKRLTRDDVLYCRLVIPVEDAIEFLPKPFKYKGRYELIGLKLMDHENQMWNMKASFYELSNSYLLWDNWDKFVNKYGLEPDDVILIYEDPIVTHFFIEFQKSKPERNPKEATDDRLDRVERKVIS